jgi:hypothetical protein
MALTGKDAAQRADIAAVRCRSNSSRASRTRDSVASVTLLRMALKMLSGHPETLYARL